MTVSTYSQEAAVMHRLYHGRYVSDGMCPSVNRDKAWCNSSAGGHERHYAAEESTGELMVWDDARAVECPCSEAPSA